MEHENLMHFQQAQIHISPIFDIPLVNSHHFFHIIFESVPQKFYLRAGFADQEVHPALDDMSLFSGRHWNREIARPLLPGFKNEFGTQGGQDEFGPARRFHLVPKYNVRT